MGLKPVLVIKTMDGNKIGVRARLRDDFVEHEIVFNSILAYYKTNNMSPVLKFLELFESVIKRTINELIPHKDLFLKYDVEADRQLEEASEIEITLKEVVADNIGFKIDGKQLKLNGFNSKESEDVEVASFKDSIEKTIETPEIVLKKYKEMNKN